MYSNKMIPGRAGRSTRGNGCLFGTGDTPAGMGRVAALLLCICSLSTAGVGCDVSGLAGGLTGDTNPLAPMGSQPAVAVSPDNQQITDQDYALLFAAAANLPEPSTDNDGIHAPAMLRWKVAQGGGTLSRTDPSQTAPDNMASLDTDPSAEFGASVLYFPDTGTTGEIIVQVDMIRPTDRTVINAFGEPSQEHEDIVVASAQATIHVNDNFRLKLTPAATTLPIGGTVSLKAIFEALEGGKAPANANIRYEWSMAGLAGAGELQSSADSPDAVFKAFSERATFTISVRTVETLSDGTEEINGPAKAVVNIDPNLKVVQSFGYYYASDFSNDPDAYVVYAWVVFPKVPNAVSYTLVGQGMHDSAYYGTGWTWNLPGNPGVNNGVYEVGGSYQLGLSLASGSYASGGLPGAIGWMDSRFSGMRVFVTAVVKD